MLLLAHHAQKDSFVPPSQPWRCALFIITQRLVRQLVYLVLQVKPVNIRIKMSPRLVQLVTMGILWITHANCVLLATIAQVVKLIQGLVKLVNTLLQLELRLAPLVLLGISLRQLHKLVLLCLQVGVQLPIILDCILRLLLVPPEHTVTKENSSAQLVLMVGFVPR